MGNGINIRLELGINAQRFMQQVIVHNSSIEDQIEKGIQLALEDISKEDFFIESVRKETLKELTGLVRQSILSWELRSKLTKSIEEKIGNKISEYADQMATKIVDALK